MLIIEFFEIKENASEIEPIGSFEKGSQCFPGEEMVNMKRN